MERFNPKPELQIVRFKPPQNFKLPDDWVVEERRRPSKASKRLDRYYYEPGTGRQFRSLLAVQKYLIEEEAKHYVTPDIDTSGVKSRTGKRSPRGARSRQKFVSDCYSYSASEEEEDFTPKAMQFSVQSTPPKTDSHRKFHLRKDERGSVHNLSRPPAKVSWVLSGPRGFWSPIVNDSTIPECEKLKWSEAFVQSIHGGLNS